jgi:F-type H+-transporting ATPase subunit c
MKTKVLLIITLCFVFSVFLTAQETAKPAQETGNPAVQQQNVQNVQQNAKPGERNVPDATPLFLWSIVAGAVGLAAAAIGGAFAQSKALKTAVVSIGRNPSAADSIRGVLIIGLALIESLVIYVLLIDLIIFFVKWGKYTF